MAIQFHLLTSFLGWTCQGDIAGWTFYTSARRRIVFYPQAPPLNPPSIDQVHFRNNMRATAVNWQALSSDKRANWQRAAARANLTVTGYNLFSYWQLTGRDQIIRTVERQTGIALIDP